MTCVGRLAGIAIYIYPDDHAPPHVHAYYGDDEVLLVIGTGDIYVGSLPRPQLAEARAWLTRNEAVLRATWLRLNPPRSP
jgi:hypothetical protein